MSKPDLAKQAIGHIQNHVAKLTGENWPEIGRILEKEKGEIKISFGVTLNSREPEPGTQAEKDDRVKTTISFSERFTASTESALESDDSQPNLEL